MGLVRLLLAVAVVLGHSTAWNGAAGHFLGFRPIPPYYAVQSFFLISGFYMELIRTKYATLPVSIFYTNRYSRLIVCYWIVAIVSIVFAIFQPNNPYLVFLQKPGEGLQRVFLAFTNIFILGQDTVQLFGNNWTDGLVIPQGWTLGAELWFYILVPFFWRTPTRVLFAIVAASVVVRLLLAASDLAFFPWQQRFFPAELMFFVLGMLACRCTKGVAFSRAVSIVALASLVLFVSAVGWLAPEHRATNSFILAAIFFICTPAAFQISRRWKVDRIVGEFSYPIYLWHIGLQYFIDPANRLWHGGLLLLLCFLASVPLVFWIEEPLERWRNLRVNKEIAKHNSH